MFYFSGRMFSAASLFAAVAASILLVLPLPNARADSSVAGVAVTSGTPEEVRALLQKKLAPKLDRKITLTDGTRTVTRTRGEWGVRIDLDRIMKGVLANQKYVPLMFTVDLGATKNALDRIAHAFYQPPVNAKPYVYKGKLHIDNGTYKRVLNVPTTTAILQKSVEQDAATGSIRVALDKSPPVLTADRLKGITGRLASFASTAADNHSRDVNITIAVEAINGTLLSPGETFSLNETVGRRTQERGFQTAHVFVDAEVVKGVGGGVSQVTGTLFNAAALAGMKILEVNPHSRPVGYLPLGRDATVAWKYKDLKFKNNTDAPVYVQYTFENQRLRATFYGKKTPGETIRLVPRVQKIGAGKINAQLYRIVKQNGKVIAKSQIFTHKYRWTP